MASGVVLCKIGGYFKNKGVTAFINTVTILNMEA